MGLAGYRRKLAVLAVLSLFFGERLRCNPQVTTLPTPVRKQIDVDPVSITLSGVRSAVVDSMYKFLVSGVLVATEAPEEKRGRARERERAQ